MNTNEAVKAIILEAMDAAREVAREEEARLGRPLTDAEVREIAAMVQRQLTTAVALAR